jgi:hypothetical protein
MEETQEGIVFPPCIMDLATLGAGHSSLLRFASCVDGYLDATELRTDRIRARR